MSRSYILYNTIAHYRTTLFYFQLTAEVSAVRTKPPARTVKNPNRASFSYTKKNSPNMLRIRSLPATVNAVCCFVLIVFALACCYFVSFYLSKREADVKEILIWNAKEELSYRKLFEAERECDYACSYTVSENKHSDINKYDAVIFGRHIFKDSRMPQKFAPTQKFIFLTVEQPEDNRISKNFDDVFDMVATYRLDSEVVIPRFYLIDRLKKTVHVAKISKIRSPITSNLHNSIFDTKSKFAAYVSANNTVSDTFINKISEFIKVDIYSNADAEVYSKLKGKYYFHFVLEDRICVDYQAESVEEALFHDTIPIVRSGSNVFLPTGSYIDIEGFSAEGLAKRLTDIVQYREEYLKYFWWKSHYELVKHVEGLRTPFCQLCKMLHEGFVNKRKFVEWWQGSDTDAVCKKNNLIYSEYESY